MENGEGNGTPLQYSCLENTMDGGACIHGVVNSQTWLSDFTFTFHFHVLEKEMATHSSVPAWRIPGAGEPGGLPSMGSHRVRHDWSDSNSNSNSSSISLKQEVKGEREGGPYILRKSTGLSANWQPTPVFLPAAATNSMLLTFTCV